MKKLSIQQLHIVINLHAGELVCYDQADNPQYAVHPRSAYEVAQSTHFCWGYYYPIWEGTLGIHDRTMNKKQFKKAYGEFRKYQNQINEPETMPGWMH